MNKKQADVRRGFRLTFFAALISIISGVALGSYPLSTSPDWIGNGPYSFGSALSPAGDVNNDGYDDIIVGAKETTTNFTKDGKVFLFLGSSSGLSTVAAWTAIGANINSFFGHSLSAAGDVNNDGYDDVIIGEPGFAVGGNSRGRVLLYYGTSSGLASTPAWTKVGTTSDMGRAVSTAGDVNGDGYSDVIVSSAYGPIDTTTSIPGGVFMYLGSASGLSATPTWQKGGTAGNELYGSSVSTAGDVNDDGYSDVIVGSPDYFNTVPGRVFVYLGKASGLSDTANWIKTGELNGDDFGGAVYSAGNVNNDGYSDVIVGAPEYESDNRGKAYAFYGSASGLSTTANWTATGIAGSKFGTGTATAGDCNRDGFSEVIIGVPVQRSAYVYKGSPSGLSVNSSWSLHDSTIIALGNYVRPAGDVNGDGFRDVIVGTYNTSAAKAFVYHGLDDVSPTISYSLLSDIGASATRNFTNVSIIDTSGINGVPGTKPRCYFKRTTDANTINDNTNSTAGWKYAEANGSVSPFDFTINYSLLSGGTGVVENDTVHYFVIAQDSAAIPNVAINSGTFSSNPSSVQLTSAAFPLSGTLNSYKILKTLSGDYTVGVSGVYATITAAVNDLNTWGASGPVRFLLIDAAYSIGATPITIGQWTGASSINTLTIKPNTGVIPTITGTGSTAVFDINAGDYFIIDGSNVNGGNSKDLTVANSNNTGGAIRFINDARNNSIKNCVIKANSILGVIFFSTTTGTSGNDSNLIQNNDITRNQGIVENAIYNLGTGTTSATKNSGNRIIDNRIFDFLRRGIYDFGNSAGALYEGNEFFYLNGPLGGTSYIAGFEVNATSIEGFIFRNNYIRNLYMGNQATIYGMALSNIQSSFTGDIHNNIISLSDINSTDLKGIHDASAAGANYNICYNSINIYGSLTSGIKNSDCYFRNASTTNLKDNILVNSRTGGTGRHYAIRTNSPLTSFTSNYNDIYNTGGTVNVFGKLDAAEIGNLAGWKTASGKDSNSISANPFFQTNTNLHIDTAAASPVSGAGTPIAGITTDFDGDIRNVSAPDIGADEYDPPLPLSGDYTVGLSGIYPTITAAISHLKAAGANGPVRFLLIDSSYTSETLPLSITSWAGASSVNTMTLKPNTGITSTISGSNSTAIFDLNNGDNFILDGSNVNGGTTKNLTVNNTHTGGAAIRFINDAISNSIKNCVIKGRSIPGVVLFSTTTGTSGNDSNLIQNNDITKSNIGTCENGIFNQGTATTSATKNSGNTIIGNRIFDFVRRGIFDFGNSAGALYEGNEIYSSDQPAAFLVGFEVNATSIEGFTFRKNYIHDLKTPQMVTILGMQLLNIQSSFTGDIYNNIISLSENNSTDLKGINDGSAFDVNYNIYFNSVNISGSVTGEKYSDCYYRSASNTNFKNNILVNSRTAGTGRHYAIRTHSPLTSFTCNYNDIYTTGGTSNVFGKLDGTERINLADWRAASGKDSNSISANPMFISNSNLHIDSTVSSPINAAGIPIGGITADIDNNTRNLTTPDIGADEFNPVAQSIDLNLTMLIEGFYNAGTNLQVSDTIKVYLRNSSSPYNAVDSAKEVVSDSGKAALTFPNAATGNYYLQIRHRNALETWSAGVIAKTQGGTNQYDFTTAATQAFGDNMKQVDSSPNKFAIYSGDVNQDETIDLTDIINTFNDANAFTSGYALTDLTGDDFVDLSDITIAFNNSNNFVSVIRP